MLSITEVVVKLVVDKWMSMEHQGNNTDGKTKVLREKNCPCAPLSITDRTLTGLGLNSGFCSVRLVTAWMASEDFVKITYIVIWIDVTLHLNDTLLSKKEKVCLRTYFPKFALWLAAPKFCSWREPILNFLLIVWAV